METSTPQANHVYEFKIRILGNEVFAVALASSSESKRWIAIALVAMFSTLTVLGAYGDKLFALFKGFM